MAIDEPKIQQDIVPTDGVSPETNPEGRTPHGIPEGAGDYDPAASPTGERFETETAPQEIEDDAPRAPGR